MKKMQWKTLEKSAALALAGAMALTACSGSTGSAAATTAAQTTAAESQAAGEKTETADASKYEVTEPIEIVWWHALEDQYTDLVNEVVDEFNKSQDKIHVTAEYKGAYKDINEALIAANAAGTGLPAVVVANTDYVASYGASGLYEDLDPYIKATGYDATDFADGLLVSAQYEGKQVSLPFLHSTQVIYYNADMAKEKGIEVPTKIEDMDAFLEKATEKAADGTTSVYGLEIPGWDQWYFETLYLNDGVKIIDGENKCDLNSEAAVARTKKIQDWTKAGLVNYRQGTDASANMRQDFYDKKAFAVMHTSSLYNNYVSKCDFNVGMAWYPAAADGTKNSEVGGCVLGIPSKNDQKTKNAAWQFLQFLCGKEVNMKWAEGTGYLPTRKSVLHTDEGKAFLEKKPAFQCIFDNLDLVNPRIQNAAWSELATTWKNYMVTMMTEFSDAQEQSDSMVEEINEILADHK
ncbi:MAG: ABC transporter substrate-binding protein [Bacillota bacterium]|nr:ABC transporter substrate-binding protein [Bacillota bacterium]